MKITQTNNLNILNYNKDKNTISDCEINQLSQNNRINSNQSNFRLDSKLELKNSRIDSNNFDDLISSNKFKSSQSSKLSQNKPEKENIILDKFSNFYDNRLNDDYKNNLKNIKSNPKNSSNKEKNKTTLMKDFSISLKSSNNSSLSNNSRSFSPSLNNLKNENKNKTEKNKIFEVSPKSTCIKTETKLSKLEIIKNERNKIYSKNELAQLNNFMGIGSNLIKFENNTNNRLDYFVFRKLTNPILNIDYDNLEKKKFIHTLFITKERFVNISYDV